MGNNNCTDECPTHQKSYFQYICSDKRCIEPLCEQCLKTHSEKHEKLGYPPDYVKISEIVKRMEKRNKLLNKQHKKQEKVEQKLLKKDNQFEPTAFTLKKLTKEYFQKRYPLKPEHKERKEIKLAHFIEEFELYKKLQNNNEAKEKIFSFLKRNIRSNEGLVGKEYSFLYD